jgi:hypothetical protein
VNSIKEEEGLGVPVVSFGLAIVEFRSFTLTTTYSREGI